MNRISAALTQRVYLDALHNRAGAPDVRPIADGTLRFGIARSLLDGEQPMLRAAFDRSIVEHGLQIDLAPPGGTAH